MLIGRLAKELGVTPKTLRHYEAKGLVPSAERTAKGYRTYSEAAVRRARLVVGLRNLGLPLDVVESLLRHDGRPLRRKLLGVLDQHIQKHTLEIAVLQGRYDDLDSRYHALLSQPAGAMPECVCGALMRRCDCVSKEPAAMQQTRKRKIAARGA